MVQFVRTGCYRVRFGSRLRIIKERLEVTRDVDPATAIVQTTRGGGSRDARVCGMRTTLSITADQCEELECRGLTLETAFVDDGSPETQVIVFRVEPLRGTRPTNVAVVKFSASKHAIPNATHLQLGTHGHYRECDGAGEGIRDEMDGRFREDISDTILRAIGLGGRGSSFSAQATRGGGRPMALLHLPRAHVGQ